jgi:DNA-binding NarL/FixJ family response regulator
MTLRLDSTPEALLEFVGGVARANTVEELQARYLAGISEFIGGFAAGLYVLSPFRSAGDSFAADSFAAYGVSDFFLSRYEESGRTRDPVLARAVAERCAIDNRSLMSAARWRSLPVYEEIFQVHRMTGLLEVPLLAGDEVLGTLNFGRNDGDGPFTAEERALAEALARLISAALESVRERDALVRERDSIIAALELCHEPVVVTDLGANTRRLNAAARRLLDRLLDREGALDALMAHPSPRRLDQVASRVTRHETDALLKDGSPALLCARSAVAADNPRVIVSFLELVGESEPQPLPAAVDAALTRREREVVALAVAGLHDAEIAERLHLSAYTVKQYLHAAYRKCGVRSRVELVRRALGHGDD